MEKLKILLQFDTDPQPSTFDAVVALDAGVDHLLRHGGVLPDEVAPLVHGAIFTRGPDELERTAIFIGGSDVERGSALASAVVKSFFGPLRVSVMIDPNGANTTAAAAVSAAARHVELGDSTALVLAATGPVGSRAARLLARAGAKVRVGSRFLDRAAQTADRIRAAVSGASVTPLSAASEEDLAAALDGANVLIAAGTVGAKLLSAEQRRAARSLRVAIDLNAVPPLGLEGIEAADRAAERDGAVVYGAIGVGGLKMKIHKEAVRRLFSANNLVLDAEEIFAIAGEIRQPS